MVNKQMVEAVSEVVECRYGEMRTFSHDIGAVSTSLRLYGEWAQNEIDFVSKFIEPGMTVVDVGAYVGTHTLAFSHLVGSGGSVIAIEAQKKSFNLLRSNLDLNGSANVTAYNVLAGDSIGQQEIKAIDVEEDASFGSAKALPLHHQSYNESEQSEQIQIVESITIDSLDLSRCDVIKIDAEGMEHVVIKGAINTLEKFTPLIYAECNSVDEANKTLTALERCDYDTFLHVSSAFNPDNFRRNTENIFGLAKEIALVSIPRGRDFGATLRKHLHNDFLLPAKTLDDVVVAMLSKPQYFPEVIEKTHAFGALGVSFVKDLGKIHSAWIGLQGTNLEPLSDKRGEGRDEVDFNKRIDHLVKSNEVANQLEATSKALSEAQSLALGRFDIISDLEQRLVMSSAALKEARDLLAVRLATIEDLERKNAILESKPASLFNKITRFFRVS